MKKELTIDEKILKLKAKIRTKKVWSIMLIIITLILIISLIIISIKYSKLDVNFENGDVIIYSNDKNINWNLYVKYNNILYPKEKYEEWKFLHNSKLILIIANVFITIPMIISIIINFTKQKTLKEKLLVLNNQKLEDINQKNKIKEIENNLIKNRYCQYCGTKLKDEICPNCGARKQGD